LSVNFTPVLDARTGVTYLVLIINMVIK